MKLAVEAYKGLKIVVAEDHDDARKYVSLFLRQLGASVVEARDGIEGLEAVRSHRPELVISDIRMPKSDGFEMLREIRALGKDGHVPAIAITAFGSEVERELTLPTGFNAFLQKPFTPDDLLETISSVLSDSADRLGNDGSL